MLGTDLVRVLRHDGWVVDALTRRDLDITNREACRARVEGCDVVINAAAYTAVDDAEANWNDAFAVNALGPENLALAARAVNASLVHISTDYVFNGEQEKPYSESAEPSPLQEYGRSKLEGERRARRAHPDGTSIVRSAWLYGAHGASFVSTISALYRDRGTVTVVDDQYGQPTWTVDLSDQILKLIRSGTRHGIFHATNAGRTSWYGLAQAVIENLGGDPSHVQPTSSSSFPRAARRPASSVLGHEGWRKIGVAPMRPWREALDEAMSEGLFR